MRLQETYRKIKFLFVLFCPFFYFVGGGAPKVPFFFSQKSLGVTHPRKIKKKVFFIFSGKVEKKNTCFFSQQKVMSHSLKNFLVPYFL